MVGTLLVDAIESLVAKMTFVGDRTTARPLLQLHGSHKFDDQEARA